MAALFFLELLANGSGSHVPDVVPGVLQVFPYSVLIK